MSNRRLVVLNEEEAAANCVKAPAETRNVLLFNLPEMTLEPNVPFPPMSLQVLRAGLPDVGGRGACHDLAPYGPRIAEQLNAADFIRLFRANPECTHLAAVDSHDLELPRECVAAVLNSGLVDHIVDLARRSDPLLIGFSIQGTPYSSDLFAVGLCKVLARALRTASLGSPVVVGGARTVEKENVRAELMADTSIDYLVRGNGQRSLRELTGGLLSGSLSARDVPGLVYRDGGSVRNAATCDPPWGHMAVPIWADHAAIPHYRRTLADLAPQARHVPELVTHLDQTICALPFQFTVGCVSECAFCNRASETGKISPPEDVVDQLEHAVAEYGVHDFLFLNSELNFGRTYVHRFCREVTRRKLDIRWVDSCEFRGMDRDTLAMMRDAGCVALWFGLESVSERLLDYIQKRVKVDHAVQVLTAADALGLYNCLNFICGLPYENEEDVDKTTSFLRDHHALVDATMVNIFYLQGGPFADAPARFGLSLRGYQEQVGQTVSKAFDEIWPGGLRWEEKKQQMQSSYRSVREVNDHYVVRDSHNMLLTLAMHRVCGGNKPLMRRAIRRMADPAIGSFISGGAQIVRRDGHIFLLDAGREEVLTASEVVARCWELRHLMIWSHIRRRLLREFPAVDVDRALEAIRTMEESGYFRVPGSNAAHRGQDVTFGEGALA